MKRFFFFIVLLYASIMIGCKVSKKQQKTTNVTSNVVYTETQKNTLLWQVSGNGLEKPSYIFGTMHLLCAEDAVLSDSIKFVLDKVDKIYFELDMDNMVEMMGAMTKMNMKNDTTLKDLYTPSEYKKVKDFFTKSKSMLPFNMMERFMPLLTSSTLMEEQMPCKDGISGIEMNMMSYNKKNKKTETLGLETIADQLSVFEKISYKEQAKMLLQYVDSLPNTMNETQKLVDAYKGQNLNNIELLMNKTEPGLEKYMDVLLFKRNKNWVEQLKVIMPKESIVAAVGAGHLVGKEGLIELLKKEGYTLSPIKN